MELVVDTNVFISAIIKSSKTRELLCSPKLTLFAPEHIILESLSNKEEILSKAGITDSEFAELLAILLSKINIFSKEEFYYLIDKALEIVKHEEDAPFLALSLAKNIPMWSNDKELKEQSLVRVFSTEELIEYLAIKNLV